MSDRDTKDFRATVELLRALYPAMDMTGEEVAAWRDNLAELNQVWVRLTLKRIYAERSTRYIRLPWVLETFQIIRSEQSVQHRIEQGYVAPTRPLTHAEINAMEPEYDAEARAITRDLEGSDRAAVLRARDELLRRRWGQPWREACRSNNPGDWPRFPSGLIHALLDGRGAPESKVRPLASPLPASGRPTVEPGIRFEQGPTEAPSPPGYDIPF